MFAKMAASMGAGNIAPQGGFAHAVGMYVGGGALGAAAGGAMNLMFGDQEDFIGSVMKGGATGVVGGAAMRSISSKGGYLNDFGLAIGRTMDESSAVGRSEKITKLQEKIEKHKTKLAGFGEDVDPDVMAARQKKLDKAQERLTKLETQEGGGITKFFRNLSETAEERQRRVTSDYDTLYNKANRTEAEDARMATMERQYGISRNQQTEAVEQFEVRVDGEENIRSMDLDEFHKFRRTLPDDPNASVEFDLMDSGGEVAGRFRRNPNPKIADDADFNFHYSGQIGYDIRSTPTAGYSMHVSDAQNMISSRNSAMLMGGAGLTGAMVGASHSSRRKSKRRGFNQNRGSRF